MKQKPLVISISAVSGGGKTTITNKLKENLNAIAFYFDSYEFKDEPDSIIEWLENGADYNAWNLDPMIKDVIEAQAKNDKNVDYILLDYPFGYLNKGMSSYIDHAIYIDTPLDIAMARRILRDFPDNQNEAIKSNISFYLSDGRKAYLEMEESVKPSSNIIISGDLTLNNTVNKVLEEIKKKKYENERETTCQKVKKV